ncbi:hypothetical protein T190_31240 [Sinorhizobium meliloti CCBAU 01290]|nr:hypothetical protein T190_31240 [Sinorhizobium meliloti CCBAU 01290]
MAALRLDERLTHLWLNATLNLARTRIEPKNARRPPT